VYLRVLLLKVITLFLGLSALSQHESGADSLKKRKTISLVGAGSALTASYVALNSVWYSDFDKQPFHVFNDLPEWNGMDKLGHVATSYNLSLFSSKYFEKYGWAKKSDVLGSAFGFVYTSSLEVLDAYSDGWGFSFYDLGSNAIGSAMFLAQSRLWAEQKFRLKYSYSSSGLSELNPALLGSGSERLLKDYNGQTYWLSFPLSTGGEGKVLPAWLDLSLGYSVDHFIRARPEQVGFGFEPRSEFFLSLDINTTRIKTRSRFLRVVLDVVQFIKVPFPALQWDNRHKFSFRPLYF